MEGSSMDASKDGSGQDGCLWGVWVIDKTPDVFDHMEIKI